jgi:uncharacterized membrane protein
MSAAGGSLYLPFVGALGIGAVAGAGTGLVIAGRRGAAIGALVGAAGSVLYAYLLAGGLLSSSDLMFFVSTTLALLGCGLMAGLFFAFSAAVMGALAQQPQGAGMATMQTLNVVVFNPWFGTAFTGTPAACVLVMVFSLLHWRDPGASYLLAGGALYLLGTLWVTAVFNVPRNDALAAVEPTAPDAAVLWTSYLSEWTAWNHVRATAAFAAATSFIIALIRHGVG